MTTQAFGDALLTVLSPLIGRESQLRQVIDRLSGGARMTTLVGPPGIGKSRLAMSAVYDTRDRFGSRARIVDLLTEPERDVGALARELTSRPAGAPALLVLDNAPAQGPGFGVGSTLAPVVGSALLADPALVVLVTARSPLGLSGEQILPLGALPVTAAGEDDVGRVTRSPAARLLWHCVAAIDPDFEITPGNAAVVGELCRQLDGLPLALELAAGRFKIYEPEELLARLRESTADLVAPYRVPGLRHDDLAGALAAHVAAVPPDAAGLLGRLSAFDGEFGLDQLADVAEDTGPAIHRLLEVLVDAQLLRRTGSAFRLMNLVRVHVREHRRPRTEVHQRLVAGGPGYSAVIDVVREVPERHREPLTARQREVAELVANGLTNRAIAHQLGISEWTAVNHVRQVLRRLEFSSRVEVARWMAQHD